MALRVTCGALRLLLLTGLLFQASTCSPVTSHQRWDVLDDRSDIEKRQGGVFSVLGVAGLGDNSVHPRLEIRELERNKDQWNVYLLGLQRFQSVSQTDKLSYYQIAGIHGRPYIAWDGVNQGPGGGGGYCTHGSNIFPTWHRPYLALFEEVLYLNARQAISEFSEGDLKDRYKAALETFRMPYWDWAAIPPAGEGSMPWSVQRPTIEVVLPNGTTTIDNPLFSYKFHPISSKDFDGTPWTAWTSTLRDPSSDKADATSRNDLVALELDKNRPNLQSRVFNVLAIQHDYSKISNDRQAGDSIESIHDTVHNTLGSDGHMSFLPYSAFDPIFWLHHTNVDRLFTIWQALNPTSFVQSGVNPYTTFTMNAGFVADANTPLAPFHRNDAGEFWTSETTRSPDIFGYTYPELLGPGNDTSSIIKKVNDLYGPSAKSQRRSVSSQLVERRPLGAPNFAGERLYNTNIKVHKFGLDGSFDVYVFIGNEPVPNTRDWVKQGCFIGKAGLLSQPTSANTTKATVNANSAVALTAALESKVSSGELESMEEDVVAAYLNKNMKWRIAKVSGEEIPVEDTPGFQMSVLWAKIKPAKSPDEFPEMDGDYKVLVDATDGCPGGFGTGDTL